MGEGGRLRADLGRDPGLLRRDLRLREPPVPDLRRRPRRLLGQRGLRLLAGDACCYDSKRDTVWAYGGNDQLSKFDLKAKTWSRQAIKPGIGYVGGYNFQMEYLPKADRVMIIGSDVCTVSPDTLASERHPLKDASGKAGLTYLPDQDAVLYLTLPGGETGPAQRLAAFDCAKKAWLEVDCAMPKEMRGAIWSRLRYDPVDKVALLVVGSGVWAYKIPKEFKAKEAEKPAEKPVGKAN
jgi:hypothetical protein